MHLNIQYFYVKKFTSRSKVAAVLSPRENIAIVLPLIKEKRGKQTCFCLVKVEVILR